MKYARKDVEYRLNDLQGMIYAACQLGAWCFDEKKTLFFTTAPHREEYHMLLQLGGCLDAAIEKKDLPGCPLVFSGAMGLGWIAEWVHRSEKSPLLVILGPLYMKNSSIDESMQQLDRHGLSGHLRREYLKILGDVPFVHGESIRNFAIMLHFACYEENLSRESILFESPAPPEKDLPPIPEKGEDAPAENDLERMVSHEEMMLRCLREGLAPEKDKNDYQGELQNFHLRDVLRQIKDNLIIFTALCARNAVRGGVSLTAAKNRESHWICRIENMTSYGDTPQMVQKMYQDFQHMVLAAKDTEGLSRAVRDCREYIRMNYTNPLTTEEIARHCGYTEYYLTRKFSREMGMKMADYIRTVRLNAAKVMLLTSRKDIQQISEELQFGSRSYFDRVFRQEVGISPRQFRETRGLGEGKETT